MSSVIVCFAAKTLQLHVCWLLRETWQRGDLEPHRFLSVACAVASWAKWMTWCLNHEEKKKLRIKWVRTTPCASFVPSSSLAFALIVFHRKQLDRTAVYACSRAGACDVWRHVSRRNQIRKLVSSSSSSSSDPVITGRDDDDDEDDGDEDEKSCATNHFQSHFPLILISVQIRCGPAESPTLKKRSTIRRLRTTSPRSDMRKKPRKLKKGIGPLLGEWGYESLEAWDEQQGSLYDYSRNASPVSSWVYIHKRLGGKNQ